MLRNLPKVLQLVCWGYSWILTQLACLCCPDSLPSTPTQMTENLEKHQEKLEEKQAACLEQIREMEKQVTGSLLGPPAELNGFWGVKGPCPRELPVRGQGRGHHPSLWGPEALSNEAALQISA